MSILYSSFLLLQHQNPPSRINIDSSLNSFLWFVLFVFVAFQKLQQQDERAQHLKDRLQWEHRELRGRLDQLQRGSERTRNDSLGSVVSSERSDSDRGKRTFIGSTLI